MRAPPKSPTYKIHPTTGYNATPILEYKTGGNDKISDAVTLITAPHSYNNQAHKK
ncbi:hypothetical protein D3C84_1074950 [compost metagenome]